MNKLIAILSLLISGLLSQLGLAASDANRLCQEYGVEGLHENEEITFKNGWKLIDRLDISVKSDEQIAALPTEVKQKIIIVAKSALLEYGSMKYAKPSDIKTTLQAVQLIREVNEFPDEEHLYSTYENQRGHRVNVLTFYPGATVGSVFDDSSLQTLATVSDGWVYCVP